MDSYTDLNLTCNNINWAPIQLFISVIKSKKAQKNTRSIGDLIADKLWTSMEKGANGDKYTHTHT